LGHHHVRCIRRSCGRDAGAARFDLLDLLNEASEVSIPVETGAAILELEHSARAQPQLRHAASVLKALRQHVVSNLETSRWKGLPPLQHCSEGRSATATGPFLRTLLDVLGKPVAEGTVCWLEDRYSSLFASIAGAPRMDALSVFRWLSKGDAGSAARADRLRRALAAAGYAFGLWPTDDIAAVIRSASLPATGQAIPRDVLEVRDYFTLEVSLLRHLNRTVIDAEIPGMPVEMRYAGRSLHLAPRLMAQIWSEGDAAHAAWLRFRI
jgi:hypothetical protein